MVHFKGVFESHFGTLDAFTDAMNMKPPPRHLLIENPLLRFSMWAFIAAFTLVFSWWTWGLLESHHWHDRVGIFAIFWAGAVWIALSLLNFALSRDR